MTARPRLLVSRCTAPSGPTTPPPAGCSRDDCQHIPLDQPAPAVTAKSGGQWWWERPATTIAGDCCVFPPGGHIANDGRDNSRMVGRSENTIRLDLAEALILQTFRPDYPVPSAPEPWRMQRDDRSFLGR